MLPSHSEISLPQMTAGTQAINSSRCEATRLYAGREEDWQFYHKGAQVQMLIEQAGATVRYLPPYSPDLNPIEMVFSKIKQMLRTLACRTQELLWDAMKGVVQAITPSDATNCFIHAGYTLHVH
jgi:hypothetical protein